MKITRRYFLKLVSLISGSSLITGCGGQGSSNGTQSSDGDSATPPQPSPPSSDRAVLSGLRDFGADWQTFWGCDPANLGGRIGVYIDNTILFEGDYLLPEHAYCGLVTTRGLTSGSHTYQMTIDGALVGPIYTFNTGPELGSEFSLLFFGDTTHRVGSAFDAILNRENEVSCVVGAELFYLDNPGLFGGTANISDGYASAYTMDQPSSKAAYQDDIRHQYRVSLTTDPDAAGRNRLNNTCPVFNSPGNHDLYKITSSGIDGLKRQPGRCLYDAAHVAAFEYVNSGHPAAVGSVDSEPSPVFYFNKTVGDVDLIVTDGISYSDPFPVGYLGKDSDPANNCTAGDNAQESWLLNRISASTANLVIVVFSSIQHPSTTGDWSKTLSTWLAVNHTDKSIVILAPDTHQSCALFHNSASVLQLGFSPTAAVTSAKNVFVSSGDTMYATDMFNKTA